MHVSRRETATAFAGGCVAVAGSFAVAGRTPAFVVAPVAGFLVDATPGIVSATAIQELGDWSQRLAFAAATLLAVGLFAGVALAAVRLGRRSEVPYTSVAVAVVGSWLLAVASTAAPSQSLAATIPPAVVVGVAEREWGVGRQRTRVSASRRKALAALGSLAGFVGLAGARGSTITGAEPGSVADVTDAETGREADRLLARAGEQSLDVSGLSGLVTPIEEFYEVDVNNVDPNPSDDRWDLTVTGAVDETVTVGFEELAGMDDAVEHRFVTLRCVGESLNGEKMDTALWTGVPVSRLLDRAGVNPSGADGNSSEDGGDECCVLVRAVDDYYQEFPLSALEDAFLAFGMNGRRLPREHGYPVRLLVPGHWGEINVKWITEIEVLTREQEGYWEKRGWHGTGPVETVAKLHTVDRREREGGGERVAVGGHAYAGTRGIQTVEVSTDGGETWNEADLSERLPGSDVWRQWRYAWDADPGDHEVVVRAIDGEGRVQPEEFSDPYPSGATGWVTRTVEV